MPFRILLSAFALAGVLCAERRISAADCKFASDPERFLGQARLIRQHLNERMARLAPSLARSRSAASAEAVRRNFIDEEILGRLARQGVAPAGLSSDEEFFRRISLDLTGRIPSSADVAKFVSDTSAEKRDAAIDRFLASPEFVDRWTMWMGDLLQNTSNLVNAAVNRGALGRNAFHAYIKDAVAQDKSFRTIATEVIAGKGNTLESGAANFPLGASTSMGPIQDTYDTMLVKTATTFLGLGNYDCLLCHTGRGHLNLVNLWGTGQTRLQAQEMAAFFSRLAFNPGPQRSFDVSDAGEGGYDLNTDSGNRPNRVPVGSIQRVMPAYRETSAKPTGDWRAAFAGSMTRDPMFARNLANRVWKQMFGLALVDPVDSLDPARLDPANPPATPWELQASHPELLEKLAAELAKGDFKLRAFLRTLTQSTVYQLSARYDDGWKDEWLGLFARHIARRLEGEEVHDAIAKATGIGGDYSIQGWSERVAWAVQLPEPVEPASNASVNAFLNAFLRGDRDTQDRSQAGSIQQQLYLMNDSFVLDRVKMTRSPKLRALTEMQGNGELADELYLTFLSRKPTAAERTAAMAVLAKAADRGAAVEDLAWMCINRVEFLFSY
ncbi:MAG: DUF1553 domain-containing protein [Bryobacteraceae bacterium]